MLIKSLFKFFVAKSVFWRGKSLEFLPLQKNERGNRVLKQILGHCEPDRTIDKGFEVPILIYKIE